MDFQTWKNEFKKEIEELKEDIKILENNISEMESILESLSCVEDEQKFLNFDLEKGLKHIAVF